MWLGAVSLNRPGGRAFRIQLGAVLQAVTGRSWQELIQTQVLQPLQMNHSHTEVNAVISRLPIGVVDLLRGQQEPQGPSLRQAYFAFNAAAALAVIGLLGLAWRAVRTRRLRMCVWLLVIAIAMVFALHAMGLNAAILLAFAPDLALVLAAALALLCLPTALRAGAGRAVQSPAPANGRHEAQIRVGRDAVQRFHSDIMFRALPAWC